MAAEFIGQPVAFDAVHEVVTGSKGIHLEPVPILPGSPLQDSLVGDMDFAARNLLLFGVIRHSTAISPLDLEHFKMDGKHFYFNPRADFQLQANDLLVLIGYDVSLNHFRKQQGITGAFCWRKSS
jgi:voltage-gated potassium channel